MLDDAVKALSQILSPPMRSILWRSIGLALRNHVDCEVKAGRSDAAPCSLDDKLPGSASNV